MSAPADPLRTAVSTWRSGDIILLGRDETLRVIEIRPAMEADEDPVLLVEPA
jgi:hypothetical protein